MGNKDEKQRPISIVTSAEDEADVIEEVGAEQDESGEMFADVEDVRKAGALDPHSIRENRRMRRVVDGKRKKEKVPFGTKDVYAMFEGVVRTWTPDDTAISVKRLTGPAVQQMITSHPKSSAELQQELLKIHGQFQEAEYEVRFLGEGRGEWRGIAKITLPDTRPSQQQGQQPMAAPSAPQGFVPFVPPIPTVSPQGTPDLAGMMGAFQQMFQMVQDFQKGTAPQPTQPAPVPTPVIQMPASPDLASMMAALKQMMDVVQSMQRGTPPPATPAPAPQVATSLPAPTDPLAQMKQLVELAEMLKKLQGGEERRPPPRPEYPRPEGPRGYEPRPEQQPRPRSAVDSFRESVSTVRAMAGVLEEIRDIMPGSDAIETVGETREVEDGPIRVLETGGMRLLFNREDNTLRGWETAFANADKVMKWGSEQVDKINRARAEREAQKQRVRQLPDGYVEVGPGYEPPPGYKAVVVDPNDLPPVPQNVPPPIQEERPASKPWTVPPIPDEN